MTFKNSVLNSMAISHEMRQQIWLYATDKPGPLVQRVSKNILAVKTAVSGKNPLGYLHFTFLPHKKDEKRFVCSCREAKVSISSTYAVFVKQRVRSYTMQYHYIKLD